MCDSHNLYLLANTVAIALRVRNEAPEESRIDEIYHVNVSVFHFCTRKMAIVKRTIQIFTELIELQTYFSTILTIILTATSVD